MYQSTHVHTAIRWTTRAGGAAHSLAAHLRACSCCVATFVARPVIATKKTPVAVAEAEAGGASQRLMILGSGGGVTQLTSHCFTRLSAHEPLLCNARQAVMRHAEVVYERQSTNREQHMTAGATYHAGFSGLATYPAADSVPCLDIQLQCRLPGRHHRITAVSDTTKYRNERGTRQSYRKPHRPLSLNQPGQRTRVDWKRWARTVLCMHRHASNAKDAPRSTMAGKDCALKEGQY